MSTPVVIIHLKCSQFQHGCTYSYRQKNMSSCIEEMVCSTVQLCGLLLTSFELSSADGQLQMFSFKKRDVLSCMLVDIHVVIVIIMQLLQYRYCLHTPLLHFCYPLTKCFAQTNT